MRDEFPKTVIDLLGKRVGYACSNPNCQASTVGPHQNADSTVNLGVAAHITAAAPGGPRYDAGLSADARRSAANGLWLCQNCAKLVDSDTAKFTANVLRDWKGQAECSAEERINAARPLQRQIATLRRTLVGHTNFVWDVVITPDGRRVLSASNDASVRMWDLASGNLLATFAGHSAFVCSLSLSPNGEQLAAGAADGTVKTWNLASGVMVDDFGHGAMDAKVAWKPDGCILTGGADGHLRLWRRPDPACARSLCAHSQPILKILFLDDDRVISVSADRSVRVYSVATGQCLRILNGHTGEVNSVAVLGDGRHVLSASEDRCLRLWDLDSGSCNATLRGHTDVVWRVAVSPISTLAASGAADNTVRLWDIEAQTCVQELRHPDCVAAVAFSADGSSLAVGCDDARIYVYDLVTTMTS